jgi:hypothetical protein
VSKSSWVMTAALVMQKKSDISCEAWARSGATVAHLDRLSGGLARRPQSLA